MMEMKCFIKQQLWLLFCQISDEFGSHSVCTDSGCLGARGLVYSTHLIFTIGASAINYTLS